MSSMLAVPAHRATGPSASTRRYLMCPPTFFTVRYRINPWMHPEGGADADRAVRQWRRLRDRLKGKRC